MNASASYRSNIVNRMNLPDFFVLTFPRLNFQNDYFCMYAGKSRIKFCKNSTESRNLQANDATRDDSIS